MNVALADRPSGLTVPAHIAHQRIGDSPGTVADLVRMGDPISGWRGEPEWETIRHTLDDGTLVVEVWGWSGSRRDADGWVVQASVNPAREAAAGRSWERTLLETLRDGDYRNAEANMLRVIEANERVEKARRDADAEKVHEMAERIAFRVRRELGYHHGFTRTVF